jgi:fungal nitric oxide reductase
MANLVEERILSPKNDLISHLITTQLNHGNLTKADVVQTAFLLLVAGNATMVSMIALGIVTALRNPRQLQLLKDDPKKWSSPFVEELCRYHTASALATKRVAKEDVVYGGKTIRKGEGIIAATMSGNRDEEVFADPDVFDITRERGAEEALGFGWGEHRCVAEWLARAELEIVFGEFDGFILLEWVFADSCVGTLWQKLPNLTLAGSFDEVQYSPPDKDVGIGELSVVF